jgi:hypothetical protein
MSEQIVNVSLNGIPYRCDVHWHRYMNDRLALILLDSQTGEPVAKATVNLDGHPMADDEIAISNDFAEEVERALVAAGIVAKHHRTIREERPWGSVAWRVCRLEPGVVR